jgi:hypothetical protein
VAKVSYNTNTNMVLLKIDVKDKLVF